MSQLLQYNYAMIEEDGLCYGCMTYSIEVPLDNYILVPELGDYVDKYYNREDGIWYWDADFSQPWEEAPQW